jgi:hypothetical protein
MKKINDILTLGLVSGALGWLPKEAINLVAYYTGVQKPRYGEVIAGILISEKLTRTQAGIWFSAAADLVLSSMLGIPVAYLLSRTGKENAAVKGGVIALMGFGGLRGLIANTGPNKVYPKDVWSNTLMTLSSLTWGLVTGSFIKAIGDESLFPETQNSLVEQETTPVLEHR